MADKLFYGAAKRGMVLLKGVLTYNGLPVFTFLFSCCLPLEFSVVEPYKLPVSGQRSEALVAEDFDNRELKGACMQRSRRATTLLLDVRRSLGLKF